MTEQESSSPRSERGARRVRHETRLRRLRVLRTHALTPTLLRVTLGGDELAGFTSLAADDHVKVFFPQQPGGSPVLPSGPPGARVVSAEGPAPISRDYTPRRFDAERLELDLEFSLHGEGPAARWAAQAEQGHELAIGGPRGSFVLQGDFDWYLLVGDETALPAIARRLEELPPGAHAFVIAEVDDAANELTLRSAATLRVQWVHRNGAEAGSDRLLAAALAAFNFPSGVGYTWIAAESSVARGLRALLLGRGHDKQWLKAAGYWKRGASNSHERIDD